MYSTYISEGRTIPDKNTVSCYRPVYLSAWLAIVERERVGCLGLVALELTDQIDAQKTEGPVPWQTGRRLGYWCWADML